MKWLLIGPVVCLITLGVVCSSCGENSPPPSNIQSSDPQPPPPPDSPPAPEVPAPPSPSNSQASAENPAPNPTAPAGFPVFDAMLYQGKPSQAELGLQPISVVYAGRLWPKDADRAEPDEASVRGAARQLPAGALVCLDVEHWPVKGDRFHDNVQKLIQVVDWVKQERPDLRVGYYGVLPDRNYWACNRGPDNDHFKAWADLNSKLAVLAQHVDVIFPSLYAFYPDHQGWLSFAQHTLRQARQYGKPVYPFLWPQYHNTQKQTTDRWLDGDFWRLQLQTCRELADGVVIWGPPQTAWDSQLPWWAATCDFLQETH